VVAEEAPQPRPLEKGALELHRVLVVGQDLVDVVLPQLVDVAEQPELIAALQVGAERSGVRGLAALKVVGAVPSAAVGSRLLRRTPAVIVG